MVVVVAVVVALSAVLLLFSITQLCWPDIPRETGLSIY